MAGSKSLPEEMGEHLKMEVAELIKSRFTDPSGKTMPEIPMAEILGISQPQLNEIRNSGKNAGSNALIALSRHTGKSINELLGPSAPGYKRAASTSRLLRKVDQLLDHLEKAGYGAKNFIVRELLWELRELINDLKTTEPTSQIGSVPAAPIAEPVRIAPDEYQTQVREVAVRSPLGKKKRTQKKRVEPSQPAVAEPAVREKIG